MKTKSKKKSSREATIPAPKKRPPPDKEHRAYKQGRKDGYLLRKFSWRFCHMLAINIWATRKEPCEKSDSRYGFYLYCEGLQDALSEKKDAPPTGV